MLAITFQDKDDYDKILEDDTIDIIDLENFSSGQPLTLALNHTDGTTEQFKVNHTYNEGQIDWYKAF